MKFSSIDRILINFERIVVGMGLLLITGIIFINVVFRHVLGEPFVWAEELTRYILVWITFIGGSMCVRNASHVTMDVVFNRLPEKIKKYLFLIINLMGTGISLFLMFYGINMVLDLMKTGQISPTIEIPMYWVYIGVPLGSFLMAKNFLHLFIINLKEKEIKYKF